MKRDRITFIDLPMKRTEPPKCKKITDEEKIQRLYALAKKLGVKIGEQEK